MLFVTITFIKNDNKNVILRKENCETFQNLNQPICQLKFFLNVVIVWRQIWPVCCLLKSISKPWVGYFLSELYSQLTPLSLCLPCLFLLSLPARLTTTTYILIYTATAFSAGIINRLQTNTSLSFFPFCVIVINYQYLIYY